jgi:hypothetical protein
MYAKSMDFQRIEGFAEVCGTVFVCPARQHAVAARRSGDSRTAG